MEVVVVDMAAADTVEDVAVEVTVEEEMADMEAEEMEVTEAGTVVMAEGAVEVTVGMVEAVATAVVATRRLQPIWSPKLLYVYLSLLIAAARPRVCRA